MSAKPARPAYSAPGSALAPARLSNRNCPPPMKPSHALLAAALAATALTAFGADAAANWSEHCAKCHGDDGKGLTKMGKKLSIADLTDAKIQEKFTDAQAVTAMKEGIKDKAGVLAMKPIEGLSEAEMSALVPLVRALKK